MSGAPRRRPTPLRGEERRHVMESKRCRMSNQMANSSEEAIAPGEAFALLGNETRVDILRVLGAADEPLPFSTLRERVGIQHGQEFPYHLDKLVDHFVGQRDGGYALRPAGRRVVEAVLSGTLTQDQSIERQAVNLSCWYCGAHQIEVDYRAEIVTLYCTKCGGSYGSSSPSYGGDAPAGQDRLGAINFPPAGVQDRPPVEVAQAALVRYMRELESTVAGVCPRCAARAERTVVVCENHDPNCGGCDACDRRYALAVNTECTNCVLERAETLLGLHLLATPEMRMYLLEHGIDPIAPCYERVFDLVSPYEEDIQSIDPLDARITFGAEGDEITLAIDEELSVSVVGH